MPKKKKFPLSCLPTTSFPKYEAFDFSQIADEACPYWGSGEFRQPIVSVIPDLKKQRWVCKIRCVPMCNAKSYRFLSVWKCDKCSDHFPQTEKLLLKEFMPYAPKIIIDERPNASKSQADSIIPAIDEKV